MEYELETFTVKKIKKIQKKYKHKGDEGINNKEEKEYSKYVESLRNETEKYTNAMIYKNKFDNFEIEEKDIPDEFVEIIRKKYLEDINKLEKQSKKE